MSEPDFRTVDIKPWIDRARRDPLAYVERQATEVVLTAIGGLRGYGNRMFLKGGVLMAVVYESVRGTADLDFTTNYPATPDFGEKLRQELDRALPRATARLGYPDLLMKVQTVKEVPRPFGSPGTSFPALDVKIAYALRGHGDHRLAGGQAPHVVDLEVSFNEPIRAIEVIRLGVDGPSFSAYALTDLIAEKFRALLQQVVRNRHRQQAVYRRQDVYDIAHLVTRFPLDESERAAILESFRDKCAARGIMPTVDSMSDPLVAERARAEWNSLRQEIGDLPDFDECFSKVEALYRALPWKTDSPKL
jgi:predicted nucleotidyltransferase component of viral defense system